MQNMDLLARNVATRMREIEYNRVCADRAADDDYALLWDAILDEFAAAGIELPPLLNEVK